MPDAYSLRPVQPDDTTFLKAVYASTRAEELERVSWSSEQKQAFVEMQFEAQRRHYATYYPEAEYSIILGQQAPIGRLIVSRANHEILLMDVALLPEFRRAGIGTALMRDLMAEAQQAGLPLRLHVETFNPARRLYERLGFYPISEQGIYIGMEWRPGIPHPKGQPNLKQERA
jgi:ribosomal protein S18 acetylase RimI-like enzyme